MCEDEDGFNTLTQVKLYNDEKDKNSPVYETIGSKIDIDDIWMMKDSVPFYVDVNKDGYADILYNDY